MKPIVIATIAFAALGSVAQADSLYPGALASAPGLNSAAAASLFSDTKARRAGDTLTILINETASASSAANTKTSKDESLNYGPGVRAAIASHQELWCHGQYQQ